MLPTYSIAKTFTSAALIRAGVGLDSQAGEYLSFDSRYAVCRIKDLLQHVSGLPDYHALSEYRSAVANREPAWPAEELLERSLTIPLQTPGEFSYSNIGFTLLRLILEKTTGKTFFESLNDLVFRPLDIEDVSELTSVSDWSKCDLAPAEVTSYDPQWVYPGMVLATGQAISQTFRGLFSGALFDPQVLFQSVSVSAPGHSFAQPHYGLGVMIDGQRWVGHGGGGPGFTLFALCKPDGSSAHTSFRVGDDQGDAALISECINEIARQIKE